MEQHDRTQFRQQQLLRLWPLTYNGRPIGWL